MNENEGGGIMECEAVKLLAFAAGISSLLYSM